MCQRRDDKRLKKKENFNKNCLVNITKIRCDANNPTNYQVNQYLQFQEIS